MTDPEPQGLAFSQTLKLAQEGDRKAMDALVRQFLPQVKNLVHHSLATDLRNNRPWLTARFSTGDVVQEVFRGVVSDLDSFAGKTERAFAGYLAMVVRNRIIDAIRFHEAERRDGRLGVQTAEYDEHSSREGEPVDELEEQEEIDRLYAALGSLPEREQLLLRARFEETASFPELCERLGYSSVSATRRAYFSAHARLAVALRGAPGESAPGSGEGASS